MKSDFPSADGFSGVFIQSSLGKGLGSTPVPYMGFVLKREYDIVGTNLVPTNLAPTNTPQGIHVQDDAPQNLRPFSVSESEVVLFKPEADLHVKGSLELNNNYKIYLTPPSGVKTLWYERTYNSTAIKIQVDGQAIDDLEANVNMFGWEPRFSDDRLQDIQLAFFDANDTPMNPDQFLPENGSQKAHTVIMTRLNDRFNNSFRRAFYKRQGMESEIIPGSHISIERQSLTDSNNAEKIHIYLPEEFVEAYYFVYHGAGKDKENFWCRKPVQNVRLDTVVIDPAAAQVSAFWRGSWPLDRYPLAQYRKLEVKTVGV